MRHMRHVVAAVLVMAASTVASAQADTAQQGPQGRQGQGMTPEQRQQRQNEMLFRGITLTEGQKVRVDSIQKAAREANPQPMQMGTPPDSATRAKMAEARRKTMADIRAVLTPEQQMVFDRNLETMPQPGQGMGRPPQGQRPPR